MLFSELPITEPILRAITDEGYDCPTPIQKEAIPIILTGKDFLGCAQTGTGKTAAFAIPILQLLSLRNLSYNKDQNLDTHSRASNGITGNSTVQSGDNSRNTRLAHSGKGLPRKIKSLILTPTRELAIQIEESFRAYGRYSGLRQTVIFGGVGQGQQTDKLKQGVDILIATPGRLLDLMGQGYVSLKDIEIFVLDEADRMLDMGFIHDIKKLLKVLPQNRQNLFFSATMAPEIMKLAHTILVNPKVVEITPVSTTAETIKQQVYHVDKVNKNLLIVHLLRNVEIKNVLVFTRTKHGADKVVRFLIEKGISAEAIHGNKSQNNRQRALSNFKDQRTRVLVATDIASRGIDIDALEHMINYDIPNIAETYVHRIGRTGRAGASGNAISFVEHDDLEFLRDIERLIRQSIPVIDDHPFPKTNFVPSPPKQQQQRPPRKPHGAPGSKALTHRSHQRDMGSKVGNVPHDKNSNKATDTKRIPGKFSANKVSPRTQGA